MSATRPTLAFAVAAVGIAIYSVMDALMKRLSIESGAYAAVLWRAVAGVAITGTVFVARGRRWPGRAAVRLHVARGLTQGASVLCFFWGLARVPMAKSVALTFVAPLIAIFLAAALLGERVRRTAIGGTVIAALGVLVIAAGEAASGAAADSVAGTVAIVVASLFYAGGMILLRAQAQRADPLEVTLFTSLVTGTVLLIGAPLLAGWPAWPQTPTIGAVAMLGTVSSLLMAWAYARVETQVLAAVEYTAFVWAALLGWLVFSERVSLFTVAGAALIVAGCLAAIRERVPMPQTEAAA